MLIFYWRRIAIAFACIWLLVNVSIYWAVNKPHYFPPRNIANVSSYIDIQLSSNRSRSSSYSEDERPLVSWSDWQLPTKEEDLQPIELSAVTGAGVRHDPAELLIVIPTVARPTKNYLVHTLQALLKHQSAEYLKRVIILISINSNPDSNYTVATAYDLDGLYAKMISEGRMQVISPPTHFYPDMTGLPRMFNDTPARVHWRSKQALDYAYLFSYIAQARLARYVLLLEDDIIPADDNWLLTIISYCEHHAPSDYFTNSPFWLEFADLGAIGKVFPLNKLSFFAKFIGISFYIEPVDWLFGTALRTYSCHYFHSAVDCSTEMKKNYMRWNKTKNLFKHVAKESSAPKQKNYHLLDKRKKVQVVIHARPRPSSSTIVHPGPVQHTAPSRIPNPRTVNPPRDGS